MSLREWLLPLVLGGLAAGAVLVLPSPDLPRHDPLPEAVEEPLGLAWAFGDAVAPLDGTATLLAVGRPDARELQVSCLDGERSLPLHAETRVLWRLEVPAGCRSLDGAIRVDAADAADVVDAVEAANGAVFGRDGHNATRVTVHVFNERGELLASSAGATDRNRFRLYGDFVTVSDRAWYLGDGAVPDGMRVPAGYVEFARTRLAGLPVGGVGWGHVPQHEYDWLTGPLWVTARVDSVLPAP